MNYFIQTNYYKNNIQQAAIKTITMSNITQQFTDFVKSNKYDVKQHQLDGFEWCYGRETCYESGEYGGGLLCDEMGLGKTLMMIACMKLNPKQNTLIVVPKSLIGQWRENVTTLLGKIPMVYHGIYAKGYEVLPVEQQLILLGNGVWITTYGMLNSSLKNISWNRIIFDEAHNMREKKTRVSQHASKLNGKIKWMVTGTPIQNSWNDVVNLCRLLKFPEGETALVKGASIEDQREYIQSIMLVRTKDEVKIKMPKLSVEIIKVKPSSKEEANIMTDFHSKLSCSNIKKTLAYPLVDRISESHLAYLIRAKQTCSHSKMVEKGLKKVSDRDDRMPNFDTMSASKLSKLIKIIDSKNKSVKKLIFYTFNQEKAYIEKALKSKNYSVGIVNGKTAIKNKTNIVKSMEYDVLLVQIKAGSDGLNLQQYGEVYFVSPHWNPAVEKQAIARIYRIGQLASKVNVYYLISTFDIKNSITLDEYCMDIKRTKQEQIDYLFDQTDELDCPI